MPQFTTDLVQRDPKTVALTKAEAAAMLQAGFRLSEFNPDAYTYTLSIPHTVIRQRDRGIITFEQD